VVKIVLCHSHMMAREVDSHSNPCAQSVARLTHHRVLMTLAFFAICQNHYCHLGCDVKLKNFDRILNLQESAIQAV